MLLLLFALIPFALLAYLLVVREVSAAKALAIVYGVLALILVFVFQNPLSLIAAASAKGVLLGVEVFAIILGVILIFSLLKHTGRVDALKEFFLTYHSDPRVHIILIGWFFVAFLEGIAGFGAPAAIAAPLLVAIGVRPVAAVVVTLIADSAAVVFGAFGTPVIVGLAGAVPGADLASTTIITAVLAGAFSVLVPLIMLVVHAKLSGLPVRDVFGYTWFALISGAAFTIPFVLTALFFGPELPSVIAPVVGLCVMMLLLRTGVFGARAKIPPIAPVTGVMFPYALVVLLLALSRANTFGFGDVLRSAAISTQFAHGVSHVISLYTPGALILASFVLFILFTRPSKDALGAASKEALTRSSSALIALVFAIAFAQLIVFSGSAGSIGVPEVIAQSLSGSGLFYVFLAPLIGAFGSFVAGSATVSNLMLASVQAQAAVAAGLPEPVVIALQAVGASAGNMIAIHNIVAVLAVVHLSRGMPTILKTNVLVVLGYCLLASLIVLAALLF